jgi:hypothetical protein
MGRLDGFDEFRSRQFPAIRRDHSAQLLPGGWISWLLLAGDTRSGRITRHSERVLPHGLSVYQMALVRNPFGVPFFLGTVPDRWAHRLAGRGCLTTDYAKLG